MFTGYHTSHTTPWTMFGRIFVDRNYVEHPPSVYELRSLGIDTVVFGKVELPTIKTYIKQQHNPLENQDNIKT